MISLEKPPCERLGLNPDPSLRGSILGFAKSTLGQDPINGLRHLGEGNTNGWYVWCGEWSDADDFFESICIEHVREYLPQVDPYLDLPSGYRFLIDGDRYEDIWIDERLLKTGKA